MPKRVHAVLGSVQGLWMYYWGWEVKEGFLELNLEEERRWDLERCLRQREQQAKAQRRHKSVCCVQLGTVCHLAWLEPWLWKGDERMLGGSAGCIGV